MYSDSHCHLAGSQSLAFLQQRKNVKSIINCQTPEEYEFNQKIINPKIQTLSYGIHPWDAEKYRVAEVEKYLKKASVIGEIGLDNVWTKVPLTTQEKVFKEQLILGHTLKKPIILHTKGLEREILQYISQFSNRYLVHWYSSNNYQKEYINLNCYFTIGVDICSNPAVRHLAKIVPNNRLLIETDGLDAISWAFHQPTQVTDYLATLDHSISVIAKLRNTTSQKIKQLALNNLQDFLGE